MSKHTVEFKAEDYKAREDRSGVPDGRYLVRIRFAEDKATKSGGIGIALDLRVVADQQGGIWTGARLDHFLNVPAGPAEEENEKVQERIFAQTWKAIEPDAKGSTFDTDDWIDKEIVVGVKNVKEPWTRKDKFSGKEITTQVEKSRIGIFLPASEWRPQAKAAAAAEPAEPASGTTAVAAKAGNAVPAGGDADMDVDL